MDRGSMEPGHSGPGRDTPGGRAATFAEKQDTGEGPLPPPLTPEQESQALASQWRVLARVATGVALLTAPVFYLILSRKLGFGALPSVLLTALAVFAFRGLFDVVSRRFIPHPGLFGTQSRLKADDLSARRRAWFWRYWYRLAAVVGIVWLVWAAGAYINGNSGVGTRSVGEALTVPLDVVKDQLGDSGGAGNIIGLGVTVTLLFLANALIFLGPLLIAGMRQIKFFEPGDAHWGVALDDVRGQERPKEEVRRIVSLWQAGRSFEEAGGKRERGVLFFGAPGTGKTMLAKAIATGFNSPFVYVPGSGLRQSFIGVDVIIVNWVTWKARRLARKWGGQCIVFIDEIDALGGRRADVVESDAQVVQPFYGPFGALNPSGDLIKETDAWREHVFARRAPHSKTLYPGPLQRVADRIRAFTLPGMGDSGTGALQHLLIAMDGMGVPKGSRRFLVNRINTLLDATYVIPPRIGDVPLRLRPARPARNEELYFVGACNVPLASLDPALTRPGRMGRHVQFRTPGREARADILDLYLGRIAHTAELDTPERRDELARITMGHSPAMIQQVCSLALTYAHNNGRREAAWNDIVEAITTVEHGLESGFRYTASEERAIAVHEAGHAVTGHAFMHATHQSSRLTITPRGGAGGHHMMHAVDERFAWWQHEKFADLVWTLGAMAAERVFYNENGQGVGGDIDGATHDAAMMVGTWGMAPVRPDLRGRFATPAEAEIAERKLMRRYDQIGSQILNRSAQGSHVVGDPVASVLADPVKRTSAAQLLGQAFMTAYWFVQHNKEATSRVADTLVEKRSLFGDDVVRLLDSLNLTIPDTDPLDESVWPRI